MPLLGAAAIAMWWDIAPSIKPEFEDWHSHEHFPERIGIPGFRRGSRWADLAGGDGFFVLYELADYEVLGSAAYLARLNAPTPWSARMMPHHRAMVRSQCRLLDSVGGGLSRYMLTLRLSPAPGQDERLRRAIAACLAGVAERPGLTGWHLLRTETPTLPPTTEQRIRGGDAVADWIVLVSGYDAEALEETRSVALAEASLVKAGAREAMETGLYRLSHSLAEGDLARSGS